MKSKNLKLTSTIFTFFLFLFILAACAQPSAEMQTATAAQDVTATATPTERPTATPTEKPAEEAFIINPKFYFSPGETEYKCYSRVTLEDIITGKTLPLERKWLEEHPFGPDAIPITGKYSIMDLELNFSASHVKEYFIYFDPPKEVKKDAEKYKDPNKLPFKIISYYMFWDEKILNELGFYKNQDDWPQESINFRNTKIKNHSSNFGIVAWAWLNPSGKTTIGHSLFDFHWYNTDFILRKIGDYIYEEPRIMYSVIEISNFKLGREPDLYTVDSCALNYIHSKYPQTSPKDFAKKWITTKEMPDEMETKLFIFEKGIGGFWY